MRAPLLARPGVHHHGDCAVRPAQTAGKTELEVLHRTAETVPSVEQCEAAAADRGLYSFIAQWPVCLWSAVRKAARPGLMFKTAGAPEHGCTRAQ